MREKFVFKYIEILDRHEFLRIQFEFFYTLAQHIQKGVDSAVQLAFKIITARYAVAV